MSLHGLESELPCRVLVVVGSPRRLAEVHAVLGLVMSQRLNAVVDQHRRPEATRATA